jgi:hypothetical protein
VPGTCRLKSRPTTIPWLPMHTCLEPAPVHLAFSDTRPSLSSKIPERRQASVFSFALISFLLSLMERSIIRQSRSVGLGGHHPRAGRQAPLAKPTRNVPVPECRPPSRPMRLDSDHCSMICGWRRDTACRFSTGHLAAIWPLLHCRLLLGPKYGRCGEQLQQEETRGTPPSLPTCRGTSRSCGRQGHHQPGAAPC